MLDKIYVVTDLGPGDGGKGSIVHYLARQAQASIIIKRGGAQGSHGVCTDNGKRFNFSQWGCDTFNGTPTYCSQQLVISPVGLANEEKALRQQGVTAPFDLLSVNPYCVCATPFHKLSSRLEELLLRDHPRGTIGSGIGQAYRIWENYGERLTVFAHELSDHLIVEQKLKRQVEYYRQKYSHMQLDMVLPEDVEALKELLDLLFDDGYIDFITDLFDEAGKRLKLCELSEVLKNYRHTAIVECSHGVLTDAECGLKPHTSALRTLPSFSEAMLRQAGYSGEILHYGVHRAYEIRHGAGPMPTYDKSYTSKMLPDSHKDDNRWQGSVRIGALDTVLMRYALDACRETTFDGLCLTWFDQIMRTDQIWRICTGYSSHAHFDENYVDFLKNRAKPKIAEYEFLSYPKLGIELAGTIKDILRSYLPELTLRVLSAGPSIKDKVDLSKF